MVHRLDVHPAAQPTISFNAALQQMEELTYSDRGSLGEPVLATSDHRRDRSGPEKRCFQ